jgi:hypothetical protein
MGTMENVKNLLNSLQNTRYKMNGEVLSYYAKKMAYQDAAMYFI